MSDQPSRDRPNADPEELEKFSSQAASWWHPEGESRPLHELNPLRLGWIERQAGGLGGRRVLDVGCGGGILSEAMAQRGAAVVGIDLAAAALAVARNHAQASGLDIDYRETAAEALAEAEPASFDVVTCMEMLEHVPDPKSVVSSCARLARPGATVVLSTINRNPRAWLLAIIGAEYVLRLLPRGTHAYARLIRPSELAAWARHAGLDISAFQGLTYSPLGRRYRLVDDIGVNYMMAARRPAGNGDE